MSEAEPGVAQQFHDRERIVQELADAYRVLSHSNALPRVLQDLWSFIRPDQSMLAYGGTQIDPLRSAANEGRRELWAHLEQRFALAGMDVNEIRRRKSG